MFKKGTSLLVNSQNSRMKIGHKIHHVRETDSTMEACNLLANLGEESGTIVSTNYQESGRGRFKRKWVSPRGDNIQISVLLRPTRKELKYLNMFASLAVLATCDQILDAEGSIKWPNDVQVDGKKISGILIETLLEGEDVISSIIGIGLNVNLDVETEIDIEATATSLKCEKGRYINRSFVLKTLIKELNYYYSQIGDSESLPLKWSEKLSTLGEMVTLSLGQNPYEHAASGLAESINEDGGLIIKKDDGSFFIANAGEVTLAKNDPPR